MEYKKKVVVSSSGFNSQANAEAALENHLDWFRKSFKQNEWTLVTGINNTPFGWRCSLEAEHNPSGEVSSA